MRNTPRRLVLFILLSLILQALSPTAGAPRAAAAQPGFLDAPVPTPDAGAPAPASPSAPSDVPVRLVASGVSAFSTQGQVFYYVTQPANCDGGPRATTISRVRTTGWETLVVFSRLPGAGQPCPYRILSNVVADAQYLYWNDTSGVVRFSLGASPTSTPETVLPVFAGATHAELAMDATRLFGYTDGHLWYANRVDIPNQNYEIGYTGPETAHNLQWDESNLYLIWGPNNTLIRYELSGATKVIAQNVTTYTPVGREVACVLINCVTHQYIYWVQSNAENQVWRWDLDNSYTRVYQSNPPVGQVARIYALTSAYPGFWFPGITKDVHLWEKQWVPCGCFLTSSRDWLVRLNGGGGTPDYLYPKDADTSWFASNFITGDRFLFWKDSVINVDSYGAVDRISVDASAQPVINMRLTGFQIIQSIQNEYNEIFLVQNKATYVRVFTKSDGNDVANVTARLTASWNGVAQDTIQPVKPLLTVLKYPSEYYIDKSFLFALPAEWTTHTDLRIQVTLNPFGFPLEPNYSDNVATYGTFNWVANPHVNFNIVRIGYTWNGASFYTSTSDYDSIVSWLYRAYPLGVEPGQVLATMSSYIDTGFGSKVQGYNDDKDCQYLLVKDGDTVKSDDRNLCASYALHGILNSLRSQGALPNNAYIYASVPKMARGSASPQGPVSNGISYLANGWPFSVSGFYGGHELGHLFKRAHPKAQASTCGHSDDDQQFPYIFAWVGDPSDGHQTTVLDTQAGVPGGKPTLYRWFDKISEVMSYCNVPYQWPSDYTYQALYDWAIAHPSPAAAQRAASPERPFAGDFLNVAGLAAADSSLAKLTYVKRVDTMVELPAPTPGPYALRLLDESNGVLAEYSFAADPAEESPAWNSFGFVVDFVPGTRSLEIVESATGTVLTSQAVSSSAPAISNVAVNAAEPISGVVPLTWDASDSDGDPLSFDIYYSADGGTVFSIVQSQSGGNSAQVDTSSLPGGNLIFRVRASDGVNTSYADSASVQSQVKPPAITLLPPPGLDSVQPGQVLNFAAIANDPQDGGLVGQYSLEWAVGVPGQDGSVFAYGPSVSLEVPSAGPLEVSLKATNSSGLSSTASVLLNSSDNLNDPLPSLATAPALVNFQSDPGDVTPQTAQVLIDNAGGPGTLDWTAAIEGSGSGWLSVDSLSGSAPYTLTLTAAPSSIPADATLAATLVISGSSTAGSQVSRIPVMWQSGGGILINPETGAASHRLYLPALSK